MRRLTQLLGHHLTLRSRVGQGSVFGVRLERCDPGVTPISEPMVRTPGNLSGTRVLIVNDDPLALASLDSLLAAWGCDVTGAASLDEALALTDPDLPPEVLITDYRLQGHQTGLEVVTGVTQRIGYQVRCILITGDTGSDTINKARAAGVPMLHKPVRPAKMRAVLQRLLQTHEADESAATQDSP